MSFDFITQRIKSRKKMLVGITSRSHEDNFQWLKEFIMNEYLEVRHLPITNSNRRDWEEAVRTCSVAILYHTKHQGRVNVTDVDGALYDIELSYLNQSLGKENVLVVLDDMDDISDIERQRILKAQRSLERLSSHLILIPERNKVEAANRKLEELFLDLSEGVRRSPMEEARPEYKSHSSKTSEPSSWFNNAINSGKKEVGKFFTKNSTPSSSSAPSRPRPLPHPTYRVGIFSRSADSNYTWFVDGLKADGHLRSADIRAFYISNHYPTFRSELQQCHFAILYDTQKQGRINITDVIGSLYDQELQEMSESLGKENVIVVVDDLESSGPEVKNRMLNSQLSIRLYARDLFLFTETEKQTKNLEEIRGIIQRRVRKSPMEEERPEHKPSSSMTSEPFRSMKNCIKELGTRVSQNSTSSSSSPQSRPRPPPDPTYRVGIFSRSAESNYTWLVESLKTDGRLRSADIKPVYISNHYTTFRSGLQQCHFAILYHTKKQGRLNITDVTDSLYDKELQEMSESLGKENVIVVVDDLESSGPEARDRILDSQLSIRKYAEDLFLFTETKKQTKNLEEIRGIIQKRVKKSPKEEERPEHKPSSTKTPEPSSWFTDMEDETYSTTNPTSSGPRPPPHPTYRVGIFSRSEESNYTWLVDVLKADGRLRSADIRAFYISNHYTTFRSGLEQCHFAILYHTKKQGRINITDVTDSLYDKELQEMSQALGRENVIVVVDDLESSGSEARDRLLDSQLSIRKYAEDFFLFTETEKQTKNLEKIRGIIQRRLTNWQVSVTAQQTEPHRDAKNNMGKVGSSVDSENRIQDPVPIWDFPPSSSGSVDCQTTPQKIFAAEPQPKRSKTLVCMEVNDLSVNSFSDLPKRDNFQPENQELRQTMLNHEETNRMKRTIEEREKRIQDKEDRAADSESVDGKEIREDEKLLQEGEAMILGGGRSIHGQEEEIREEDKVLHEGEANVQEVDIEMKTSFQKRDESSQVHRTPQEHGRFPEEGHHIKENLQNTAGSKLEKIINEKDCEIQRLREENQSLRDEIQDMNNEQLTYKLLLSECRCQNK